MSRLALITEYPTAVLGGGAGYRYFLICPDAGGRVVHLAGNDRLLAEALRAAHPGCRWARAVQQYRTAVNGDPAARKFYDEVFKHYVMMVLTK